MCIKIKYLQLLSFIFLNSIEVWAMDELDPSPSSLQQKQQEKRRKNAQAQHEQNVRDRHLVLAMDEEVNGSPHLAQFHYEEALQFEESDSNEESVNENRHSWQAPNDDEWNSEDEELGNMSKGNAPHLRTPFAEDTVVEQVITYIPHLKTPLTLLGNGSAEAQLELKAEEEGVPSILYTPQDLKAEVIGFEPEEALPDFSTLNPQVPFPADFGFGKFHKRIRYSFTHEGREYTAETLDTLSPAYLPEPEWELCECDIEEQTNHRSRLNLLLKVKLEDNSPHIAFTHEKFLDHVAPDPSQMGPQLPGKLYFDGKKVTLRQCRQARYTIPACLGRPSEQYDGLFKENEQVIPTHANSDVVFVEPLPIPGEALPDSKGGYRGDYDYPSQTLPAVYQKGNLTAKFLIYSDGDNIFLPKVTHELWERNGWRVGFGIASYQTNQKLEFIPIVRDKLPKGLYRLDSIKDEAAQRVETWIKLGEDSREIRLTPPAGVSSIPGMGCMYVPPLR